MELKKIFLKILREIESKEMVIDLADFLTQRIKGYDDEDLTIEAGDEQDIIIKMGDDNGANGVSFTDGDDTEVAALDSEGVLEAEAMATDVMTVKHGSGADLLKATVTAAFGDPATELDDGFIGFYRDTGDGDKVYVVTVYDDEFYRLGEMTVVSAE